MGIVIEALVLASSPFIIVNALKWGYRQITGQWRGNE